MNSLKLFLHVRILDLRDPQAEFVYSLELVNIQAVDKLMQRQRILLRRLWQESWLLDNFLLFVL